eukprot:1625848-Prymnesium_polylepis.1
MASKGRVRARVCAESDAKVTCHRVCTGRGAQMLAGNEAGAWSAAWGAGLGRARVRGWRGAPWLRGVPHPVHGRIARLGVGRREARRAPRPA